MTRTHDIIHRHDSFLTHNYPRLPHVFVKGEGSRLTDADGKQFLDMFCGFGAGILGHCHPELAEVVAEQAKSLWHVGNLLHNEPQTLLAERISRLGFGGKSFFCHSGSDANEAAFKLARLHGEGRRFKVIATERSFHGRGFAAMVATGQPAVSRGFEPYIEGFTHVPYNDLQAVEAAVDDQTAAVIIEPIQGEGGVRVPDSAYLVGLRQLCDDQNLLLIMDEVWTGCGRTGRYFGYQHWPIKPDVMTLGKAVGAGLALGVTCVAESHAHLFDHKHYGGVAHATTLGGNCLTTAVSNRMFEILERDQLVERAEKLGAAIESRLSAFAESQPLVAGTRGKGLFLGIEIGGASPEDAAEKAGQIYAACLERALLLNRTQGNILRIAPALTISDAEVDEGLSLLASAIESVAKTG